MGYISTALGTVHLLNVVDLTHYPHEINMTQATRQSFYLEQIAKSQSDLQNLLTEQPRANSLFALVHTRGQTAFADRQPPIAAQEFWYEKNLWLMTLTRQRVYAPAEPACNELSNLFAQKPWAGGVLTESTFFYRACLKPEDATLYSNPAFESLIESMIRRPDQLYREQLKAFWDAPYSTSNPVPRWRWLAEEQRKTLHAQAALRFEDRTLDARFMQLFDRIHVCPSAAQRADLPAEQRPSTLKVSLTLKGQTPAVDLVNVFILTSKTPPGNIQATTDCGPVALYSAVNGIETFASLQMLDQTLQTRLDSPDLRKTLLHSIPWQDQPEVERQSTRHRVYTPVDGDLFENSIQALLGQQHEDLKWRWQTLAKADTDLAVLEDAFDRAADIGPLLDIRTSMVNRSRQLLEKNLPNWYENASLADRQILEQLQNNELAHNQTLAILFEKTDPVLANLYPPAHPAASGGTLCRHRSGQNHRHRGHHIKLDQPQRQFDTDHRRARGQPAQEGRDPDNDAHPVCPEEYQPLGYDVHKATDAFQHGDHCSPLAPTPNPGTVA